MRGVWGEGEREGAEGAGNDVKKVTFVLLTTQSHINCHVMSCDLN